MNNINIKNIFANNIIQSKSDCEYNPNITIGDFSIETLVDSNTFKSKISDDFVLNKIKSIKQNEITKTNELYELKYNECMIHINNAIDLGLTDIIYSVGVSYFGYQNYNSTQCLLYIEKKLKDKNFLTLRCSNKDVFVSWKHI